MVLNYIEKLIISIMKIVSGAVELVIRRFY